MQPLTVRVEAAVDELRRWRNLEECLLVDVHIWNWTYAADLVFNYVWDDTGKVRSDALVDPCFVTLRMTGLQSMVFDGALSPAQRQHPERINWGLSEVALVAVTGRDEFLELSVEWESERRLLLVAVDCTIVGGRAERR